MPEPRDHLEFALPVSSPLASTTEAFPSLVRRLLERTGNPLGWHPANRCLLIAVVASPFTLWSCAIVRAMRRDSRFAPYVDQAFYQIALTTQVAALAAWLIVIAIALVLRKRTADCRLLIRATLLVCVAETWWVSYMLGLYTNLVSGLLVVGTAAMGWALMDRRSVTQAIVALLTALAATTWAEQAGLLPYAPVLSAAPFAGGKLAASWLVTVGCFAFVLMLAILALVYFIIDQWHHHEGKLLVASENLARANELISRYVASQLAEQIKEGNYDLLERHARRKLTLFFSDIEGFAAVADRVEPEDLSSVLNEYLSEMTAVGKQYGATIDKFVGDAIMIFFGAPVSTSDRDHALRAVRMAMAMQERMVELRSKWVADGFEHPFHIRIGINTGQASIGNFGSRERMDYTAIGRQVNLAARLQAHCERDRILLSHSTWVLVKDAIACEPRGEIQVKGLQQPVTVYEVGQAGPP